MQRDDSRAVPRSPTRLALEPRWLFDGAAVATLVATTDAAHAEPAHAPEPHAANEAPHAGPEMHAFDLHAHAPDGPSGGAPASSAQGTTLVFVSADLNDAGTLLAALPPQSQVVLLDPQRDGLQQIEAALAERHDIAAIHLVTHGGAGSLQLGSTTLDATALTSAQQDALAAIGTHLVVGGDVLVYGCDFAAGAAGHAALDALAQALDADVAASDDATGSAARGGDWTLEQHAGAVFTRAIDAAQWDGLLLNTPPVAVADVATVAEDASVTINVLANDTDLQGDALTVTSASALHGSVVINANGTLTYTPAANYNGLDTITYTIRDAQNANAVAPGTVAVTVTALDDLPTVNAISVPVFAEDTPLLFASINGTLLSLGDIDGGLARLTLSVPIGDLTLSQTAGLTLIQGDGTNDATITVQGSIANLNAALNGMVYTPGADYNGPVMLTVDIRDTLLALPLVTTTIPLGIAAVADIAADTVTTPMNTAASFNVLANDTFENAGRIITGYTTPSHGTLTLDAQGNAVYTPTAGYTGADSFSYTVTSNGTTETTTVTITALAPNNAPTLGVPGAQAGAEDTALVFSTANGNALSVADADGGLLTVTLAGTHGAITLSGTAGLTFTTGDGTADATMVFSGSVADINAALQGASFNPSADYHGAAVLSLQVSDGQATQSANVALTLAGVADGVADVLTTPVLTPVTFFPLANDAFDGAASVVAVGAASHGTVVLGLLGAVTYTPDLNYHGSDAFTYTVSAGGVTEVVSVIVTVGTNYAPVTTGPGTLAIADGQLVVVNAGVSFSDPNVGDVLSFSASGLPAGLTINASTGFITGTVGGHASQVAGGTYAVQITATDPSGASVTGTLTITVTNPGPIVTASAATGQEDTNLNLTVLVNASDPDGDALTVTGATALHGSVVVHPDGSLTYTPFANYNGLDTISYTVQDADGASATGSVLVTLAAVVDLPTITLPTVNLFNEDTPLIFGSLMGQQISVGDVDGAILDVRLSVPIGALTLAQTVGISISEGDGTDDSAIRISGTAAAINAAINGLIYTPGADYHGPLTLTIELGQLGQLLSVNAVLPLGIAAVVDIADDNVGLLRDQSASFNVLANDTFEHSGRVVSGFTTPAHGTLTIDAQGNAVYTPAAGYVGADSFTYTVTSNGTTETATVTLAIAVPPNTAPSSTPLPALARFDGQAIGIDTAGHFSDADGDALAYSASGLPPGLAIDPATGRITGTLGSSASQGGAGGAYSIVVTADDGRGGSASQTFTLTATNPGPNAANDAFGVAEDGSASGNLLANDSDPDGDALQVDTVPVTGPAHGVLTLLADGSYTYVPDANYFGSDSFSYRLIDADGASTTATVSITVTPVNDAPTSTALPARNALDGATLNIATAANFGDIDGDTLAFSATGLPAGLTIDATTGVIAGTLGSSASQAMAGGVYTIVVGVSDSQGGSTQRSFTLTVSNPAPTAADDSITLAEDGSASGNVLANDSDADGDALQIEAVPVSGPAHGTLVLNANGSYTYTPNADYHGADSFQYQLLDADGASLVATVHIVVTAQNDAPTSSLLAPRSGTDGAAITVATAASFADVDGDTLAFSATGLPAGLTIDPATGLIGGTLGASASQAIAGGVYTVVVTATDPSGSTSSQGFTLTVSNPPPVAVDDSVSVAEDGNVTGNLLGNDSDADGDALTLVTTPVVSPAHGSVVLNANGSYSYTPDTDFHGTDSFSYRVVDADGASSVATVSITVTATNDAPTSTALAPRSANDGNALSIATAANFSDVDGEALAFSASGLPSGLTIDASTGLITGTLGSSASQAVPGGVYTVVVTATDPSGASSARSLTLTVGNPGPSALNDTATVNEDGSVNGNVLANDSDADGDTLVVDTTPVSGPAHGTLVLNANGTYTYTPNADYHGPDSFSYRVVDADGASTIATVSITVSAVNDAPTSTALAPQSADDGASVTIATAANFADVDGDALVYSASGLPAGLAIDAATGLITGTLDSSASQAVAGGVYTIVVTATDPSGASSARSLTLTVGNPGPSAANDTAAVAEDASVSGNVLANDSDADGDALSIDITPVTGPAHGTLVLAADGSYTYTPAANFNGSDSFTYRLVDADGGVATATVFITVTAVNDAPTSTALAPRSANDGDALSIATAANFGDVDGDTLAFSASGLPSGLTIDASTGLINGTLGSSASQAVPGGVYTVVVTATDPSGASIARSLTLTVGNPGPSALNDTATVNEDGSVTGNVLANDGDVDSDTLSVDITPLIGPAHGTLALAADGSYTYTPAANFSGSDSFAYRLIDADGGTSIATVFITVTAVNDAPTSTALAPQSANDGAGVSISTASNFADADGETLAFSATGLPAGLSIDAATGQITGTLGTSASQAVPGGVYTIVVTATDASGATTARSFTLTATNTGPVAANDTATVNEDGSVTGNVRANDSDPDGDAITIDTTPVTGPAHGTLVLAANGSYSYTPAANFSGSDSFTYRLVDADGGVATATVVITVTAVNDAPGSTPLPDRSNTIGTPVSLNAASVFADADGDTLAFQATGLPPGLAIDPASGVISGTPLVVGSYAVTLTATDPAGASSSQSFVWTATLVGNNAPNTVGTVADRTLADAAAVAIATAGHFADPDGDALQYSATGLPPGLAIDAATGQITGTLASNASSAAAGGVYAIVVTASDGQGGSASQSFTLTAQNLAPTAANDTIVVDEDGVASGNLLANDQDPDGDALQIDTTPVAGPAHGTLVLNANGSYTYTPAADYAGADSFSYRVIDADGASAIATVAITVAAVNDAPEATPLPTHAAADGAAVLIDAAPHFSDRDGDTLAFGASGLPAGLAIDAATGRISGVLASAASSAVPGGVYAIVVTASDGHGGSTSRSFTLTASNLAPVAANDSASVNEDGALAGNLLGNDSDADGDALTLDTAPVSGPLHGTLVLAANGSYSYVPDANYHGSDSFSYRLIDADGASAIATVSITVVAVNDAPVSSAPAAESASDGAVVSIATAANFSDADGDALAFSASGLPAGLSIDPATGLISGTLGSGASQGAPGGVYTIVVSASDASGASTSRAFTLTVANVGPIAANDSVGVDEDGSVSGNVLANDSDADGDALSIDTTPVAGPAHGTLVMNANGSYSYTPAANFHGSDSFTYRLVDADGGVATATVVITIAPVNDAPTSTALAPRSASDGAAVSIATAESFADADGDALVYSASGLPAGLQIDAATGQITGTLASGASTAVPAGAYAIVVTARDASGAGTSQGFTLTATNAAPVAANDTATVDEDATLAGNLLANDRDADGDALVVDTTLVSGPAHGRVVLRADGGYTYTPDPDFSGRDAFSYRLVDADGAVSIGTVSVTVTAVNDAPRAAALPEATARAGTAVTIPVGTAFSEIEGQALTFSASGLPAGVRIDPATGTLSGTPSGSGRFDVIVVATDPDGAQTQISMQLDVAAAAASAPNPAPAGAGSSGTAYTAPDNTLDALTVRNYTPLLLDAVNGVKNLQGLGNLNGELPLNAAVAASGGLGGGTGLRSDQGFVGQAVGDLGSAARAAVTTDALVPSALEASGLAARAAAGAEIPADASVAVPIDASSDAPSPAPLDASTEKPPATPADPPTETLNPAAVAPTTLTGQLKAASLGQFAEIDALAEALSAA